MEAVKLFEKKDVPSDWEYDGEAAALYISFGKSRTALGVDVGDWTQEDEEFAQLAVEGRFAEIEARLAKRAVKI